MENYLEEILNLSDSISQCVFEKSVAKKSFSVRTASKGEEPILRSCFDANNNQRIPLSVLAEENTSVNNNIIVRDVDNQETIWLKLNQLALHLDDSGKKDIATKLEEKYNDICLGIEKLKEKTVEMSGESYIQARLEEHQVRDEVAWEKNVLCRKNELKKLHNLLVSTQKEVHDLSRTNSVCEEQNKIASLTLISHSNITELESKNIALRDQCLSVKSELEKTKDESVLLRKCVDDSKRKSAKELEEIDNLKIHISNLKKKLEDHTLNKDSVISQTSDVKLKYLAFKDKLEMIDKEIVFQNLILQKQQEEIANVVARKAELGSMMAVLLDIIHEHHKGMSRNLLKELVLSRRGICKESVCFSNVAINKGIYNLLANGLISIDRSTGDGIVSTHIFK